MSPRKAVTVRPSGEAVRRERWRDHAERMAARLVADGIIRDSQWRDAFAVTPRHLLLLETTALSHNGCVPAWWMEAVYADELPNIDATSPGLDESPDAGSVVAPSQPSPAVLAWLLELLIPDGTTQNAAGMSLRALEIGAGRGYTTALLCHRLGAEQVTATDPHNTDYTRSLLASLDLFPCLVTAQGVRGASAYGPFDAILCATNRPEPLSRAWFAQLAPGGRIVAAVRGPGGRIAANVYDRSESGRRVRSRTVTRDDAEHDAYAEHDDGGTGVGSR